MSHCILSYTFVDNKMGLHDSCIVPSLLSVSTIDYYQSIEHRHALHNYVRILVYINALYLLFQPAGIGHLLIKQIKQLI